MNYKTNKLNKIEYLRREITMKKVIEGHLIGTGLKVAIVVARFNEFIT